MTIPFPEFGTSLADLIRDTIFLPHGGAKQYDCWLSKIADDLADTSKLPAMPNLAGMAMPVLARDMMSNPHTVVDYLLDHMDEMKVWEYQVYPEHELIKVVDPIWNHVIEVLPDTLENMQSLAKKYGVENGLSE